MPSPPPRLLQVDADAFYVQVARLVDSEGAGRADLLLVGGSPEGRGVVTSASYPVRRFGVRSGMAMAQAIRLCPDALVVGVPRRACSERSRAIVAALERFTPVVEPASIDEMYLDLSGTERLYHGESLEATARRIRTAVTAEAGITVSIGGGTNRLVAKLAAGRAKPHHTPEADGVVIVPPGEEERFLTTFALADIPGVGPRFDDRLAALGLRRVPDALRYDRHTLRRWLGARAGDWLYDRIRGVASAAVERRGDAKSLSRDETFAVDLDDDADLRRELLRLSDRAAADLRAQGYRARTVSVRIRDRDFRDRRASRTLPEGVTTDRAIADVALALLARLRRARPMPARLLSVSLTQLSRHDEPDQTDLFGEQGAATAESDRDRRLSEALDQLRGRFGSGAIGRGERGPRRGPGLGPGSKQP
ncbi:MAG: DNA polymerase IV [Candidatus Palauibacterales bacterium]|nr:DNA polymerase IV [Candidatus Palauibacterales bacterium]